MNGLIAQWKDIVCLPCWVDTRCAKPSCMWCSGWKYDPWARNSSEAKRYLEKAWMMNEVQHHPHGDWDYTEGFLWMSWALRIHGNTIMMYKIGHWQCTLYCQEDMAGNWAGLVHSKGQTASWRRKDGCMIPYSEGNGYKYQSIASTKI